MKRLAGTAVLVLGLTFLASTLPACAQRGAAHGGFSGGHGGGFSGGGFHGGFSAPAPSHFSGGFMGGGFSGARSGYPASGFARPAYTPRFSGGPSYRPSYNRSGFGANRTPYGGRDGRRRRVYESRNGAWFAYEVPAFIGPGYGYGYGDPGYPDTGYYDDADAAAPVQESAPQYDAQPGEDEATREPYYASAGSYPPGGTYPQAAPANEDAVTLIFKDGRPSEQIHNYALTRTTLFVLDERHQDIPVEEIDLGATAKVNREAGVEFQLPVVWQ
jgi:hypothetical protein